MWCWLNAMLVKCYVKCGYSANKVPEVYMQTKTNQILYIIRENINF